MAAPELTQIRKPSSSRRASREVVRGQAANELVFAVVGHVGSGTSTVAVTLKGILENVGYDVEIVKARVEIEKWARAQGYDDDAPVVGQKKSIASAEKLQNWGDEMRAGPDSAEEDGDHAAVARALIRAIRSVRADRLGSEHSEDKPVLPDGKPRAYVLDAIRHPAEVHLLRTVYQNAFTLIGVVCDEDKREERLVTKFSDAGKDKARAFMDRDARAPIKHGQRVSKAFHLADVFLDNSEESKTKDGKPKREWDIPEQLSRIIKIITHAEVMRPSLAETAMYQAYGAQMRSACLSRQVGAALVDRHGNIVATGTNEVPRAGGGVYGETFQSFTGCTGEQAHGVDERCARRDTRYCSNTKEQREIVGALVEDLLEAEVASSDDREKLEQVMRRSRIGELLEFSRAVHAEMDALLTAGRRGVSTAGTRLFVTTFPCHYCARHVVSAGVDEVQYIEPYPKSRAFKLHADAMTKRAVGWTPPSLDSAGVHREGAGPKVLFRPFTGVAPRMYRRAFLKDRDLKNDETGDMEFGRPDWVTPWHLGRLSYAQLELELSREESGA